MGQATNRKAEVMALWATLNITKDKQIAKLNIHGDSKTVIEWAQERNNIRAPHVQDMLRAIRLMQPFFASLKFNHV